MHVVGFIIRKRKKEQYDNQHCNCSSRGKQRYGRSVNRRTGKRERCESVLHDYTPFIIESALRMRDHTYRYCLHTLSQNNEKRLLTSSCLSVLRLSVCPHGTTRLPLDRFSKNLIFQYFSKICQEN